MSPREAARQMEAFARHLPARVDEATRGVAQTVEDAAVDGSSGTTPLSFIRRHRPYRIGGGTAPVPYGDASIINSHTGLFVHSWFTRRDGPSRYAVINNAPYAGYLANGTSRMIVRPIDFRAMSAGRAGAQSLFESRLTAYLP